jgi:hypothetical protein
MTSTTIRINGKSAAGIQAGGALKSYAPAVTVMTWRPL